MKKSLVIGATGQIGSDLVPELRAKYGNENVVAVSRKTEPSEELKQGPCEFADAVDKGAIEAFVKKYEIDTVYHLASILSATGETNPELAWKTNMESLKNVLDLAREYKLKVFWPSSIAAFGPTTPRDNTPQRTVLEPGTMYGVTKVAGELLCNYYFNKYEVDVRSIRYPGIISYRPRNNLVVVAWRAEESVRFGIPYIGSRVAFGCLENEDLMLKKGNDLRLMEAMEKSGHSYEGRSYLEPEMIKSYIELHAEQGRTLYELKKPIGIVTSISGNLRFYLRFIGNPDHTGGCKHEYRKNASLVTAELELAVAELPWQFRNRSDFHLTSTLIRPSPNLNFTTVPNDVLAYIEIRCNRDIELNEAYDMVLAKAEEIAERRSVVLKKVKEPKKSQVIEKLDPYVMGIMADSAISLGESPLELPSGAGHDAVTLSKLGIPSAMLFVPSFEGYAHHPDEFTHPNDLKKGAEVLAETIIRIDKEKG